MRFDTITDEALTVFLDSFYAEVRRDPLLAPVFARAIAPDEWPSHLGTIHGFWSSILLKTSRYKGNPFTKHRAIGGIALPHFDRWLALFAETAAATFEPDVARELIARADRIGDRLKAGLFFELGQGVA